MDALLRNAGEILETAAEAQAAEGNLPAEYWIAVSRTGSIRMIADAAEWSLSALAAEYGAAAVYRVSRRVRSVRVEAWSAGRSCVLTREIAARSFSAPGLMGLLRPPCCVVASLA